MLASDENDVCLALKNKKMNAGGGGNENGSIGAPRESRGLFSQGIMNEALEEMERDKLQRLRHYKYAVQKNSELKYFRYWDHHLLNR